MEPGGAIRLSSPPRAYQPVRASALIASCSGAGKWRYSVATETPFVGAISRADIPEASNLRGASTR